MNNFYYNVNQRRNTRATRGMTNVTGISNVTNTPRGEFLNDLIELRLTPTSFLYLPYMQWKYILKNRSACKIQRWYRKRKAQMIFVDR